MAAILADDIFKCNFVNENIRISNKISLKFVHEGSSNNIPSLVQIMAWRRQAIIWTNVDPVCRRIYAALGGNELNGTQMHLLEFISSTIRQLMPKQM